MQFFVDSADCAEIRALSELGLVDGVTTNPSLVAKTGRGFFEVVREICAIVPGPVSAEVVATDTDGMLAEGGQLAALAKNVVVKLPLTQAGLRAAAAFRQKRIATNVTCASARCRRSSPPKRAPPMSRPSSGGWTILARTAPR